MSHKITSLFAFCIFFFFQLRPPFLLEFVFSSTDTTSDLLLDVKSVGFVVVDVEFVVEEATSVGFFVVRVVGFGFGFCVAVATIFSFIVNVFGFFSLLSLNALGQR